MSSRGQVVIPGEIRKRLGLRAGAQFVVVGDRDVVILKVVCQPSLGDLDALIAEGCSQARRAGVKRSDIARAVAAARRRR
ncbi:MAG: AbrB/MazE/SpoVT family DNA-binding domain-containing protein [Planctomycetota bacterium]